MKEAYEIIESIFGHEHVIAESQNEKDAEDLAERLNKKNPYIVYRVRRYTR